MDRLDEIEKAVTAAVAGGWAGDVERFRKALLALWSANGQRLTPGDVQALARRHLDPSPRALSSGLLVPAAAVGDARVKAKTSVLAPSAAAVAALRASQSKPGAAVAAMSARALGLDLTTTAGVLGVLGPLGASVNQMQGAASWAVNSTANEALVSAARQAGEKVVFWPERDACLECIDRAGETGEAAMSDPPPVHPHCRCELQTFEDEAVPLALKREGVRSVLRGFSLPSESEAARLRAAKEMLARRPKAPKSVQEYARNAVERGKFGRSRAVPYKR